MGYKHAILRAVDKLTATLLKHRKPTLYCGRLLWLPDAVWQTVYCRYETSTGKAMLDHLRPGDTFWDVGANRGFFSLFASSIVGAKGCIVAFEPVPEIFSILAQNLRARACSFQYGVGKKDERKLFFAQGLASAGASFVFDVTNIYAH